MPRLPSALPGSRAALRAARTLPAVCLAFAALGAAQTGPTHTFTDITARAGITFSHDNGATGNKWYPELFGGGVAVLDIDGDRWPDLLFVNGKDWHAGGRRARQGLFLNKRDGTFRDVSPGSGLDAMDAYALGASVADYDNDGRDDVFVTTVDGGRLFHNDAVVLEHLIATDTRQVHVNEAVVVDVSSRHPHPVPAWSDAAPLRDVREAQHPRPISRDDEVVAKESIRRRRGSNRRDERCCRTEHLTLDQEEITEVTEAAVSHGGPEQRRSLRSEKKTPFLRFSV